MERVQFQQEQMLSELKDLIEKNIFTIQETRLIMKKRTEFERALVRRVAKKSDFLRYAQYEMDLEQLRKKRLERLMLPSGPPTVSDYALVRRKFQIFERALKKFKSDVGLWVEYIQEAKREGARTLVGRITARALQLHPNVPALYIIAASHELDHSSPSSARALLQRGIRLNKDSTEMWREYVRMELGFTENLRRRWNVLGIKVDPERGLEKAKQVDACLDVDMDGSGDLDALDALDAPVDGAGKAEEALNGEAEDGSAARKEIMNGAIVKSVISSAVTALPRYGLFETLYLLIEEHPSPESLRSGLLEYLDGLLKTTLPNDPKALGLLSRRLVSRGMTGVQLVEGIRAANEMLLSSARNAPEESVFQVYVDFVLEWCRADIDDNLKEYLIKSLEKLIRRSKTSPSLLAGHLRSLMATGMGEGEKAPAKIAETAANYTTRNGRSTQVWIARLEVEKVLGLWDGERRSKELRAIFKIIPEEILTRL